MSPLEVTAIAGTELFPAATDLFKGLLFIGTYFKEVSIVGGQCYTYGSNSPRCRWSRLTEFERLWETSDATRNAEQWHAAVGSRHKLLATCCAVTSIAGLAGFITPVKMVAAGLGLMVMVVYNTPQCTMLPNLMFAGFLGITLLWGDNMKTWENRAEDIAAAKKAREGGQAAAKQVAPKSPEKDKARKASLYAI